MDFTRLEGKKQTTQFNKLMQFNTTDVLHAWSLKLSGVSYRTPSQNSSKKMFFVIMLAEMLTTGNVAKNNKTRSFYVLFFDKTWVLTNQSAHRVSSIL